MTFAKPPIRPAADRGLGAQGLATEALHNPPSTKTKSPTRYAAPKNNQHGASTAERPVTAGQTERLEAHKRLA